MPLSPLPAEAPKSTPAENTVKNTAHYLGISALALLTGCASSMISPTTAGYDTQGCVEDALRRSADKDLILEATSQFGPACAERDWAACSALGVISERGSVGAPDDQEAARLYSRACDGGNARSCVNLGKLLERVAPGGDDASRAQRLFAAACDAGEEFGCAALGRALARGSAESRDRALELLESACQAGRPEACFDLAELKRRGGKPSTVTLSYYAKSCVAGNTLACQRMDSVQLVAAR